MKLIYSSNSNGMKLTPSVSLDLALQARSKCLWPKWREDSLSTNTWMQSMHRVESKCFLLTLYGVTGKQFYSRNACAQLVHRSHLKFLLRLKNFPAQPSQSTRWIAVRLVFLWRRPADSRVSWSLVSNFSVMIVAFKIFSSRGSPLVRRFSSTIVFNSLMVVVALALLVVSYHPRCSVWGWCSVDLWGGLGFCPFTHVVRLYVLTVLVWLCCFMFFVLRDVLMLFF